MSHSPMTASFSINTCSTRMLRALYNRPSKGLPEGPGKNKNGKIPPRMKLNKRIGKDQHLNYEDNTLECRMHLVAVIAELF